MFFRGLHCSMTPRIPVRTNDRGYDYRHGRTSPADPTPRLERTVSELRDVTARLERIETRLPLLENTLRAVAREAGVSIGCPCDRCERSYLLIANGMMTCPTCGYQQSI
ncbi:hypothetical protein C496_01476 [Natronorubrum tibetense GA33]|uniref:Uncharacterized protein n=2 Tax=Natronorubrum tibetense TaxID=63128 RepID=L9WAA1_9EURY|nr:hypothetical protein C496_01476 [Natronorubrum tibetense GA33]